MIELTGQVRVRRLTGTINIIPSESGGGGPLQAKTVYPSHSEQVIAPDEDFYGLVSVTVKAVPRVPACEVSVSSDSSNVVENVINIGVKVTIGAKREETVVTQIEYETHALYIGSGTIYVSTEPVVTYSFPVTAGETYTITMTEIGNRLRMALTAIDPSTITETTEYGVLSDYTEPSSFAVGDVFTYTATADGWYLVYVSNQGERPVIDVIKTEKVFVDEI